MDAIAASNGTPGAVQFVTVRDLPYLDGVAWQKRVLGEMAADTSLPGTVIFAEHRAVVTCGRSGDGSNLLASPASLAAEGVEYHPAARGGDVTYHGPGQWTVYPLLRLDWYGRNLHRYLRLLEECVIRYLSFHAISGIRRPGLTGVWVDGAKLAAVGVAVSRWISWHGMAVNIDPDLARFTRFMHPCGITADRGGVTSLAALTGKRHEMEAEAALLRRAIREVLSLVAIE